MKLILNASLIVAFIGVMSLQQLDAQTPVAYWNFDDVYDADADTTLSDSSGNGHDGIWQNASSTPGWEQGILGGAVRFPGGSSDINAKNFFETAASITQLQDVSPAGISISAWINAENNGGYDGIVMTRSVETFAGPGLNFGIAVEESGGDPVTYRVDTRQGGTNLDSLDGSIVQDNADAVNTINGWQHVVWTWDNQEIAGDNAFVYINGQLSASAPLGFGFQDSIIDGGLWALGSDVSNPSDRIFDGLIDDVAIYNVVLTPEQAEGIYDDGVAGTNLDGGTYPAVGQGTTFEDIRSNYRQSVTSRGDGDLNYDGFVDAEDFRLWKDNLPLAASAANVPEPTTFVLLSLASLCGLGRSRKMCC